MPWRRGAEGNGSQEGQFSLAIFLALPRPGHKKASLWPKNGRAVLGFWFFFVFGTGFTLKKFWSLGTFLRTVNYVFHIFQQFFFSLLPFGIL